MERIKHPPNEESPEEIGGRVIRELLERADPEQTLEEDFLEINARNTQREITTLQLAMEERKRHICTLVTTQTAKHLKEHPSFTKAQQQSRIEAAHAFAKKQIDELRAHTRELMKAAYVIQKLREADIRAFCRNYDHPRTLSPPLGPPFRVRGPLRVSSDELRAERRERAG